MKIVSFFLLFFIVNPVMAALSIDEVIYQFNKKKSTFTPDKVDQMIESGAIKIKKPEPPKVPYLKPMFPVHYDQLSVGFVKKRKIKTPITRSICLIGNDKFSIAWIKRYKKILTKNGVTCFYVSGTERGYLRLKKLMKPIVLSPVPIVDIIHRYNIKNYPVLISGKFLEQGRLK